MQEHYNAYWLKFSYKIIFMENKVLENLEQLKKMLVLLSEDRKVVLSHHKTFEHVEKMRTIVNESIEEASKS